MKICILGGDSKVVPWVISKLSGHDVSLTTRRSPSDGKIFLELTDRENSPLGNFDVLIVSACDFQKGRSDYEQSLKWNINVECLQRAISRFSFKKVIFLSSYLAKDDTAYGRQKKAIENWIISKGFLSSILRIGRIDSDQKYESVSQEIVKCLKGNEGIIEVL